MLTSKQIRWTLDVMPNACKQLFRILNSDTRRMGRFSDVIRGYKRYALPKVSCIPTGLMVHSRESTYLRQSQRI